MGPYVIVAILTMCAIPLASADEWSKSYTLTGKPDLQVETSDANIHVTTWDRGTLEARVTTTGYKIGEHGIRIEEHQIGNSVQINLRYPHEVCIVCVHMSGHVDVEIHMPREGNVNLHTGDGKIDVNGVKGEMDLHSGDGSETIDAVEGKLRASAGDGHITARGRFIALNLKTGDGSITVHAGAGSSLAAGWNVQSGDGSIRMEIPGDLAADVELHTGDGHIDLDMPITTEGRIRQNEIHGKLNGGGNPLVIHTGDGSIHLAKG
jgi:DUF4097 and DUF4098 domain-containing protein YvlB